MQDCFDTPVMPSWENLGCSPIEGKAVKFDDKKLRTDLLPVEAMEAVADILTFGAKKYADRNWEKGMDYSRLYGAALRHMFKWWRGEDVDDESGKPHIYHAACCLMMLAQFVAADYRGFDNRPHNVLGD